MNGWNANEPNNGLEPLPPQGFELSDAQQQKLIEAASLLARLDEAADLLANPAVFNNVMPLLEIVSSSRIESIITTNDEMFVANASATQPLTPATRQALAARAAMNLGFETLASRPISIKLLNALASQVLGYETGPRNLPGTFLGGTEGRIYTPPTGEERITRMLGELVTFLSKDGLHPILRMILAHYQFEAIHPYPDGNGRTGRILNHLILNQSGLLKAPVLDLSSYLVANRNKYYEALHGVESSGDWSGWTTFVLDALIASTADSYGKLKKLTLAQLRFGEENEDVLGKFTEELVQLLFEKPYCQIGHVVERLSVSRPTASKVLEALVRKNVLTSFVSGKEKFFVNTRMLEVLK